MAATIQQELYGTIGSVLTTELNSLASAAFCTIGAAQGSDATTAADLFGDFELVATYGTAPTAGTTVDLYLVPSIDGTNYADTPTATTAKGLMVGSFELRNVTTAQRIAIRDVPLPPGLWKAIVQNNGGQAMAASGNTVKMRPHSMQSV
jgi:hypothetical protein